MIYISGYQKAELLNFSNDNTISTAENTREIIEKPVFLLEQDSQAAIDWFKINEMIVNSDKFQAIVFKENCRMKDSHALKLLGIEIEYTLSFDKHISTLCRKATNQLNAIGRIQK